MTQNQPAVRSLTYTAPCGVGWKLRRLSFRDWGDPRSTDPPLICLHGLSRNAKDFDALAAALSKTRRVIAPDMPGRGDSDPLCKPEDYSFLLYTTLVGMLISHLEYGRKIGHASEFYSHLTTSLFGWLSGKPTSDEVLRRMNELVGELGYQRNVDIVGTSMGGIIGMMFASIPGAPLRRLVINDVGPTIPGLALERMKHYVGDNPLFNNVSELECYLRRVHNGFVLNDEQWATMARNSMRVLPNGKLELNYDSRIISALSRGGFSPFPGQIPDSHLLWPFFLAIDCPMLLLRGKDSDVLPLDIAQDMLKRRPNCRMNEYPGGHAPCLVDATQIADIERFLTAK